MGIDKEVGSKNKRRKLSLVQNKAVSSISLPLAINSSQKGY